MPTNNSQGLRGLKGLSSLSPEEQLSFMSAHSDKLNSYRNPRQKKLAANILYMNQRFINTFGKDVFDKMNDSSEASYNQRNQLMFKKAIEDETLKLAPFNNGKRNNSIGLGADWERFNELSDEGKYEVLTSSYLNPQQFSEKWKGIRKQLSDNTNGIAKAQSSVLGSTLTHIANLANPMEHNDMLHRAIVMHKSTGSLWKDILYNAFGTDAVQQEDSENNQAIFDNIYNKDTEKRTQSDEIQIAKNEAYQELSKMSDDQIQKAYVKAITKGSYVDANGMPHLGIPEFQSHYGNGSASDISSEMENFSIDDMRETLAKKAAYEKYMSPGQAMTALNNEAKNYIADHQGAVKAGLLRAKDFTIRMSSYAADQVNGAVAEPARMALDKIYGEPEIWIDTNNNIVDTTKGEFVLGNRGKMFFKNKGDNTPFEIHKVQISRSALNQLGKEADGSDIQGLFGIDPLTLNARYWSRAEQFGTWDADLQKKYEDIGSSPYQIAYRPGETAGIGWKAFMMGTFSTLDMLSLLAPLGITKIGKAMQGVSKLGKVYQGLGKVVEASGQVLAGNNKVGAMLNGIKGATGIGYAYSRGAYAETLEKNLANLEENTLNRSRNEVEEKYRNDKEYKAQVDALIKEEAIKQKAAYLNKVRQDGGMQITDMQAVDKYVYTQAQHKVINDLINNRKAELESSEDYIKMQQEALNGAGDAAMNTYLTESLKYSLVNTLGHRKFLYKNSAGLERKLSSSLKGIKEVTTKDGRKRLIADASKFATNGKQLKELGKTTASQIWGGAWTNGTDDMQVAAAEQINDDSYGRYLKAYENGEALADTYSLADSIYSYIKGFNAAAGKQSTLDAAVVGGLGSLISGTVNFANLASLATKQGRQAYKDRYWREAKRDEDGVLLKDKDGNIQYTDYNKKNKLREQANFFISNGILNSYYAKKQGMRDAQSHADYVNDLLDNYNDFKSIEHLLATDMATQNYANMGDAKTGEFIKALSIAHALETLGNNSDDPTSLSSTIQSTKALINDAATLGEDNNLSKEQIDNLIAQYYQENPGLPKNEENDLKAIQDISSNAIILKNALDNFDAAEKEIQKIKRNSKSKVSPDVGFSLKMKLALNDHWEDRLKTMKEEIEDNSSDEAPTDANVLLATIGSKKAVKTMIKSYEVQQESIQKTLEEQQRKSIGYKKNLEKAQEELKWAQASENTEATKEAEGKVKEAESMLRAFQNQEKYLGDILSLTKERLSSLSNLSTKVTESNTQQKILKAREIMELDPISRARMLDKKNRANYSLKQQKEIEKAETLLINKDADGLQKIQDIALLTQRIAANKDAYSRIAQDPEAADAWVEHQREKAAMDAQSKIWYDVAKNSADIIKNTIKNAPINTSSKELKLPVFHALKRLNPIVLDLMLKHSMLPASYSGIIHSAKNYGEVLSDIDAVIQSSNHDDTWKKNLSDNIKTIADKVSSKEKLMAELEKVIDDVDDSNASRDINEVLEGLKKLGYQRDATVLEDRKKRREERKDKEDKEKARIEEAKKQAEKAAKVVAEKKVEEETKKDTNNGIEGALDEKSMKTATGEKPSVNTIMSADELSKLASTSPDVDTSLSEDALKANANNTGVDTSKGEGDIKKSITGTMEEVPLFGEPTIPTIPTTPTNAVSKNGETPKEIVASTKRVYDKPLKVASTEYESLPETLKHEENAVFEAHSAEKVGEDWHYIGNFAGTKEQTKVKAKNISDAEKTANAQLTEEQYTKGEIIEGTILPSNIEIVNGTITGRTPTLEEQINETSSESKDIALSEVHEDADNLNDIGQATAEADPISISGNAMSRYKPTPLEEEGKLVKKVGEKENDHMNAFYAWIDAAGIKLQNIIDNELAEILKRNPHAKVKFMGIKPDANATHDNDVQGDLFLVLDYNDSINKGISTIHDNDNGGIIESNGKKYLIIGVAGFPASNKGKQTLYNTIWRHEFVSDGLALKQSRKKFFDEHSTERFYVNKEYSTEVVPYSLIPGYIVKQMEEDAPNEVRSIGELLDAPERNPHGLTWEKAAWGIQEQSQFLVKGASPNDAMVPRDLYGNLGRAFILIPASNGKLVPVYFRVLKYAEMNEGALKERINNILRKVASPNYKIAEEAIKDLLQIFYLSKEGDNILRSKDILTLKNGDTEIAKFKLDSNFNFQDFIQAVERLNPRINITARVIDNPNLLKQYDEAGALMTDIAMLGTAGSSYNIYALDKSGKMLMPESPVSITTGNSDFKKDRNQVIYNHQYYMEDNGVYSLDGKIITDDKLIEQLQYNKRIVESKISPSASKGTLDYYILSTGEHPEVISLDRTSKEVKVLSEEKAKEFIDKIKEEEAKKQRDKNALDTLEEIKNQTPMDLEDVDIMGDSFNVDPESGEIITENSSKEKAPVATEIKKEEPKHIPISAKPVSEGSKFSMKKFADLVRDNKFKMKITKLLIRKWGKNFKTISDMESFLKSKNIEVDSIGTTQKDIEAWIKTIEDCR